MHLLEEDLRHILVDSKLVTKADFDAAAEEGTRNGQTTPNVLIGRGALSEQFYIEGLSSFFYTPFIDLSRKEIDPKVLALIPETFAKSRSVVLFAFDAEKRRGKLAMLDPEDFSTISYLRILLGGWVDVFITSPASLRHGLAQYKQGLGEEFSKVIEENLKASFDLSGVLDVEKLIETVPVITILDAIIEHASVLGASDIHFEPFEGKFLIRYRIDGMMQEVLSLPTEVAPILAARVKVLAKLAIDIQGAPQDGRFRFSLEDQFIDIRVSVIPTFHGEKVEMRLLKGSLRPLALYELGLSQEEFTRLGKAIKTPHGMILVTGPTGSGKTTTLYSILGILNTNKVNITTIEDPVEYDIAGVNQTQVNVKAGLTFATGLRSLVRQNPDIIMVGEIRDAETVDIAVNAALTGHLLLSTLHTNDAATTIPRLIDLGTPPFLIASTIKVVMAQRLVRKNCPACVASTTLGEEDRSLLKEELLRQKSQSAVPKLVFAGKGCQACGFTGYRGQIGIFEVLYVTDTIRELITKESSAGTILAMARKGGMKLMFEDGLEKVEAGHTTLSEVLRVTHE